jgi:thiosulfate dehydrogenase
MFLFLVSCQDDAVVGPSPMISGDSLRGGLLYDKWWVINSSAAPTTDHPAYPAAGQRSGDTTWRCKEWHGWDYLGRDGAYATGSHFTGIIGVLGAAGDDSLTLFNMIKTGPNHDFSQVLSDNDVSDLVDFVMNGTIDMRLYIDYSTKAALGNAVRGETLYGGTGQCVNCHGADGRLIDFGGGEGVGDLARGNPWETLHKIRWGHPGTSMPSAVGNGLSTQNHVDILTYSQSLP